MTNPNLTSVADASSALPSPDSATSAADCPQRPQPPTRKADPLVRAESPDSDLDSRSAGTPACRLDTRVEARKADPLVRAESPDSATPPKSSGPRAAASSNPERREGVSLADYPQHPQPPIRKADPLVRAESPDSATPPNPSTGPRTPAGKARSSRNAVTHGLRATKLDNAVAPELRSAYEALRRQYLDEYRPSGAIESTLLDMVIFAAWQLYKIREMELFTDIDLGLPGSFGRSEKLARYRGSHERLLFRSLNQLRQIQQERALLATDKAAQLPAHIAPGVKLKPLFAHLESLARHPKTKSTAATTGHERRRKPSSSCIRLELPQS